MISIPSCLCQELGMFLIKLQLLSTATFHKISRSISHFFYSCRSFTGRIPQTFQPQGINLGVGCVVLPVVVHEIGHALGFFQEHSREDRDNYVRVIANNIMQGFESAFGKVTSDQATTLNLGYDYASIMHYSATTFARQGASALVANDPNIPIGDAQELSPLDAAKANLLYNCSKYTPG